MSEETRIVRYRCASCGYEDYVGVDGSHVARTVRRRCAREFRRHADRSRKRFVLAGTDEF